MRRNSMPYNACLPTSEWSDLVPLLWDCTLFCKWASGGGGGGDYVSFDWVWSSLESVVMRWEIWFLCRKQAPPPPRLQILPYYVWAVRLRIIDGFKFVMFKVSGLNYSLKMLWFLLCWSSSSSAFFSPCTISANYLVLKLNKLNFSRTQTLI